MYTEDEAKKKWCPMYRVATSGGDHNTYEMDNRPRYGIPPPAGSAKDAPWTPGSSFNPWATCVGSICMAWRQEERNTVWSIDAPTQDWEEDVDEGSYRVTLKTDEGINRRWRRKQPLGYCGLAGKP